MHTAHHVPNASTPHRSRKSRKPGTRAVSELKTDVVARQQKDLERALAERNQHLSETKLAAIETVSSDRSATDARESRRITEVRMMPAEHFAGSPRIQEGSRGRSKIWPECGRTFLPIRTRHSRATSSLKSSRHSPAKVVNDEPTPRSDEGSLMRNSACRPFVGVLPDALGQGKTQALLHPWDRKTAKFGALGNGHVESRSL
jgi:hypothetical protein